MHTKVLFSVILLFATIVQARTCPPGGSPSPLNSRYCCNGPYVESSYATPDGQMHTVYAEFQPGICGCPDGGNLSRDHRTCCKDGFTYGGYYVSLSDDIINNRTPNPDAQKGEYIYLNADVCGCPNGWEEKNGRCCRDGWEGQDYIPGICGCPDGGIMEPKEKICIKDSYTYNPHIKKYANLFDAKHGCPTTTRQVDDICCKDAFTYDNDTHDWTKADSRCGCPDGGQASSKSGKGFPRIYPCCKNGFLYNSETGKYDKTNDYYCQTQVYQVPATEMDHLKNDSEAFFKYWQSHQDQFKKKSREKRSESPYYYERMQK